MRTRPTLSLGLGVFLAAAGAHAQYAQPYGQQPYGQQPQQSYGGSYSTGSYSRPAEVDNVGNEGQLVFAAERLTGVFLDSQTTELKMPNGMGGSSTTKTTESATTIGLFGNPQAFTAGNVPRLALDFFVTEGVSVGGSLTYASISTESESEVDGQTNKEDGPTISVFLINPRVGYAIPFDETFGLWIRAGLLYGTHTVEEKDSSGGATVTVETTTSTTNVTLDAPFVISPIEHVAIFAGPYLHLPVGGSSEMKSGAVSEEADSYSELSYGLTVGIGGYY
ncbi:MAG: hypothetical protein IT376_14755 [Polyangiaceae bacterium]|nr:hypothetical protein [Polyangiaceae bacterium]